MSSLTYIEQFVIKPVIEIQSLIPDSILFGSFLLYFLTHHQAFGVFALFLVEVVGAHRLISWVISQTVGPSRPPSLACRAGYKIPQYQYQRIFSHDAYPSYSIFSVTAIATYLGMATSLFSPTMDEMGPEWSTRKTVAYVFIGLFLAAFLLARLYSCESLHELGLSVALAVLTGVVFFYANQSLFGEESMNFLGIPYLVRKDEEGSPIYICSATKTSPTPSVS
jgi:nitrate reductase NapE component